MASRAGRWLPSRCECRLGVGARPTREDHHVLRRNRRAQKLPDDCDRDPMNVSGGRRARGEAEPKEEDDGLPGRALVTLTV